MGFFRRKQRNAHLQPVHIGVPVDPARYAQMVAEFRLPELPDDGRFWMARVDIYDDGENRLLWHKAATYPEAKQALEEFAQEYGEKPQRISKYYMNDLVATWGRSREVNHSQCWISVGLEKST